jgi:intraflagellar transport protein 80
LNRNLYLVGATASNRKPQKLATMVDSCEWSDASECLVALSDGKLVQYLYPRMVFVDRELLPQSTFSQPAFDLGKSPRLTGYNGPRITARKQDGSIITKNLSQYPVILYSFVKKGSWDESIRLCRFVQMPELWAALAGLAIAGRHLETAEIALAAIEELDKLQYIMWIKEIPSVEGRHAELALYRGAHDEAESILLQARPPLLYRAVKMNIRLYRWERALSIAMDNKKHIDTVLHYREQFLVQYGKKEDNPDFLKMKETVEVNIDDIKAARAKEKEDEKARAGRGS